MKQYLQRFKSNMIKLFDIIKKTELKILPGQLAFSLVMSIFPILTLLGIIASTFNISVDSVISFIETAMPTEISQTLIPFVDGTGLDFTIGISMIVGFFIASNGAYSLIVTSNQLYEINDSNYLKKRIKAIFLTILLVVLFIFVIVLLGFGNSIINFITELDFMYYFAPFIRHIYSILKLPLAFLIIFFIIKIIYVVSPDSKIKSVHTTKGSLFTTIGIILSTVIYSYYVSNFGRYDIFYGSLANIIVMMMWIYLVSYIVVIGISINVNSYNIEKNE